ncbi:MAG: efflux RND transporter periplasmic adaptor subunit [Elusimicrobiota bacterium]|jgi:multidrug efflux pump subunit AcrA (membrane-fusion protein)
MIPRSLILAASAFLVLCACGRKQAQEERLDTFPVRTAAVERRDVEETVVLVASVKAKDEAELFCRVPGKLLKNLLKEGERVKKGQPVALVERDEVGVRFEPAPVPSTLDGVVARTYLDQGENVTLQTPVALIVDDSELLLRAQLPERYASRARAGQEARLKIDAWPDKVFAASLSRVSPVVDTATRSTMVEARLKDSGRMLRSGMFGEMTLVLGSAAKVLSVPAEAVVDGSGPSVFVIKDGKAHKREILTGLHSDGLIEVKKGLEPGEQVAVFGLYGLKDGSAVEVLSDAAAGQEPVK